MANLLVFIFGILGNIVSGCVYLSPLPTFRQIYKNNSTLGYESLPYVVALFSAMLWMYYALMAKDATLISINSVGCVIETLYIIVYLKYATREARKSAVKQILSLNICFFGFILLFTLFEFHGPIRFKIVGWVCVVISTCVYVAPLGIVAKVIRTRSVEFMPFSLSFFLTLGAVIWFLYGLFKGDMNVALPNILGFFLGLLQMLLYAIFRKASKKVSDEEKLPGHIVNMVIICGPEVYPVDPKTCETKNEDDKAKENKDEKEQEIIICDDDEKSLGQPPMKEPNRAPVEITPSPPVVLLVCAG